MKGLRERTEVSFEKKEFCLCTAFLKITTSTPNVISSVKTFHVNLRLAGPIIL